jgi:hypothetical protein
LLTYGVEVERTLDGDEFISVFLKGKLLHHSRFYAIHHARLIEHGDHGHLFIGLKNRQPGLRGKKGFRSSSVQVHCSSMKELVNSESGVKFAIGHISFFAWAATGTSSRPRAKIAAPVVQ